jgi:hypothetical protein
MARIKTGGTTRTANRLAPKFVSQLPEKDRLKKPQRLKKRKNKMAKQTLPTDSNGLSFIYMIVGKGGTMFEPVYLTKKEAQTARKHPSMPDPKTTSVQKLVIAKTKKAAV